jgi:hypothetical protein
MGNSASSSSGHHSAGNRAATSERLHVSSSAASAPAPTSFADLITPGVARRATNERQRDSSVVSVTEQPPRSPSHSSRRALEFLAVVSDDAQERKEGELEPGRGGHQHVREYAVQWRGSLDPFLPSTAENTDETSPTAASSSSAIACSSSSANQRDSGTFAFVELFTTTSYIAAVDGAMEEMWTLARQQPQLRLYPLTFHTAQPQQEGQVAAGSASSIDPWASPAFTQRYEMYSSRLYEETQELCYPPQLLINGLKQSSPFHRQTAAEYIREALDEAKNPPIRGVFFQICLPAPEAQGSKANLAAADIPDDPSAASSQVDRASSVSAAVASSSARLKPVVDENVDLTVFGESDFESESSDDEDEIHDGGVRSPLSPGDASSSPAPPASFRAQQARHRYDLAVEDAERDAALAGPSSHPSAGSGVEARNSASPAAAAAEDEGRRRKIVKKARQAAHHPASHPSSSSSSPNQNTSSTAFLRYQLHLPPDAPKAALELHFAVCERDLETVVGNGEGEKVNVIARHPIVRAHQSHPLSSLTLAHGRCSLPIPRDSSRSSCVVVAWVQQRSSLRIIAVDQSALPPLGDVVQDSAHRFREVDF